MSLKNKNYLIIRQAFATELMDFCNVAFKIKRNAMHVLKTRNNFFSIYCQVLAPFDTLRVIEKHINVNLVA